MKTNISWLFFAAIGGCSLGMIGCERYHDTPLVSEQPDSKRHVTVDDSDDELSGPNAKDSPRSGDRTVEQPSSNPADSGSQSDSGDVTKDDPLGHDENEDTPPMDPPAAPKRDPFSLEGLLQNLGYNITYANTLQYLLQVKGLQEDVSQFCQAAEADTLKLTIARNQWRKTMAAWQQLEVAQFGPLALSPIRQNTYSWDLSARPYFVLTEALNGFRRPPTKLGSQVVSRGLDAMEAGLFPSQPGDQCSSFHRQPALWKELNPLDQHQALCSYLEVVMNDLVVQAEALRFDWHPDYGNYSQAQLGQGQPKELQKALNNMTDALFYLDDQVKSNKLGIPMGQKPEVCQGGYCQCLIEHRYSNSSLDSIYSNMASFYAYFTGEPSVEIKSQKKNVVGIGLDDYLESRGFGVLASKVKTSLEQALDRRNQLAGITLYQLVIDFDEKDCKLLEQKSSDRLCAIYYDIKSITELFRHQVLEALDLDLPSKSAGDGD